MKRKVNEKPEWDNSVVSNGRLTSLLASPPLGSMSCEFLFKEESNPDSAWFNSLPAFTSTWKSSEVISLPSIRINTTSQSRSLYSICVLCGTIIPFYNPVYSLTLLNPNPFSLPLPALLRFVSSECTFFLVNWNTPCQVINPRF